MDIVFFNSLPSTQEYLNAKIKQNKIDTPTCIVAQRQTKGIGSRGNRWESVEEGLYFSFCKRLDSMPSDLAPQSFSIFFGYIFKEVLEKLGSKLWLKYPNDLYLGDSKIGGVMCSIIGSFSICGIGINTRASQFRSVESGIIKDKEALLREYFASIEIHTWESVFSAYKKEFYKNYPFSFHLNNRVISLENAVLLKDGALKVGDEVVYIVR